MCIHVWMRAHVYVCMHVQKFCLGTWYLIFAQIPACMCMYMCVNTSSKGIKLRNVEMNYLFYRIPTIYRLCSFMLPTGHHPYLPCIDTQTTSVRYLHVLRGVHETSQAPHIHTNIQTFDLCLHEHLNVHATLQKQNYAYPYISHRWDATNCISA